MAEVMTNTLNAATAPENAGIEHTTHIPIAQLSPLLAAPASRSIKAVVTLTWPYSSVTGSVAFLLAEPDFRLRRTRGQVRVQFAGSSAKAISQAGIASGDEIVLCLDGVKFVHDQTTTVSTPGRGVEFELRFTERLVVEFRPEGSEKTKKINIDHPPPEPEILPARLPTPESSLSPLPPQTSNSGRDTAPVLIGEEWSSPAFIKRARTSYGSLFDSEYDPFAEEDGSVRGKGRKRTRLSASWRYNSRSPTPGSEDQVMEQTEDPVPPKPAPTMTDEACQTIGLEEGNAAEALAIFSQQATNVLSSSYPINGEALAEQMQDAQNVSSPAQPELPLIHTINGERSHSEIAEAQQVPRSPGLQPIPSDSLPLVSPILTFKSGSVLSAELAGQATTEHHEDQSLRSQLGVVETGFVGVVEELEDLYTASPIRRREEAPAEDLTEFQAPSIVNAAEVPRYPGSYLPEDQYGHWQSVNAQPSASSSPYVSKERVPEGHYYEAQPQEVQYHDGSPTYQGETQYPALEDGLQDNGPSDWGFQPAEVRYPEIPQASRSREGSLHSLPPPPRSAALSRSQSAVSEQIDLTEDSDDEPPQPRLGSPSDDEIEEEEFDEEEEEEEYPDYGDELEPANIHLPQRGQASEFDEEQGSEPSGSSYYEDELEEGFEEEDERDGESFDEMEDETPHVTGPPEVIDLLSSDDEDELAAPVAQSSRSPQAHTISQNQQESEEEDEDGEDEDGEDHPEGRLLVHSSSEHQDPNVMLEDGESDVDENIQEGNEESESRVSIYRGDMSEDDQQESVTGPLEALLDSVSKQASEFQTPSRTRPFPLTRHFGMDGANDVPEVSYPELPEDNTLEIATQEVERDTGMATLDSQAGNTGNFQLPTPADTQLSDKVMSAEHSFTSIISEAVMESEHVLELEIQTEVEVSETVVMKRAGQLDREMADAELETARMDGIKANLTTVLDPELPRSEPTIEEPGEDVLASNTPPAVPHSPAEESTEREPEPVVEGPGIDFEPSAPPPPVLDGLRHVQSLETLNVPEAPNNKQSHLELVEGLVDLQSSLIDESVKITYDTVEPSAKQSSVLEPDQYEATHDEVMLIPTTPAKDMAAGAKATQTDLKPDSPRRSARRPKPTPNAANQKENLRPTTPNKATRNMPETPTRLKERTSPLVALDTQSTPEGHDASIELALAAADSPIKHDLRKPPVVDLKLRLSRALRTDLSKFTPLKLLRYNMNKKIDVLAVATTSPPEPHRAKGGPRHYSITFNITDPSIAPSGVAEVQIFRPYKDALPTIEVGDGILLRNFLVVPVQKGSFALRSTQDEGSAWAAFKDGQEPEVRGPPIELGDTEKEHIFALKAWYGSLDSICMAKISRANGEKAASSATPGKSIAKA